MIAVEIIFMIDVIGSDDRVRTDDLPIMSRML